MSFQLFFALIPLALFAVGLLGLLGMSEVWKSDVAPEVESKVSPAAFTVINDTVTQALEHKQLFWVTLGAALVVWEVSGAMRATMQVLNRVYDVEEERPFKRKLLHSIVLAAVVSALLLLAAACTRLGPPAGEAVFGSGGIGSVVGYLAAWLVAIALMFVSVTIVVRFAPAVRRPARWVSFGGALVILSWVLTSLVYGWYVTSLANYGSIFGSLAVVMITLSYIYLSAIAFLTGVQLDSLIRRQID
jgi:membrane protein